MTCALLLYCTHYYYIFVSLLCNVLYLHEYVELLVHSNSCRVVCVSQKFLLQVPGGVFGAERETRLLACLEVAEEHERVQQMSEYVLLLLHVLV